MDRLTFEGNFCDIVMCRETYICGTPEEGCSQKRCWERLKAYEDTGLTIDRIQELAQADKEGRVVVLPCKMGGEIWMVVEKRPKITHPSFRFVKRSRLTWYNASRCLSDFGKTVFLTREEAEAAMKAREQG